MKRFLKNVFAILKKTNETKRAAGHERQKLTPSLQVQSQVKAGGSFQWGIGR